MQLTDSTNIKTQIEHLLNGQEPNFYYACLWLAYAGYVLAFLWSIDRAKKNNPRTPKKVDWRYLLKNNWWSIPRDLITIPFVILLYKDGVLFLQQFPEQVKFLPDWLVSLLSKNERMSIFIAFLIGGLFRGLVWLFRMLQWKIVNAVKAFYNTGKNNDTISD